MTYVPHKWVNGGKPAINAKNLNEMDEAIAQLFKVVSVPDITTTTSTTQPNSYAGREMILEIGGVTEQGENPSPTNPQEIKKSVVSGVKTHHKNFWSYGDIPYGTQAGISWNIPSGTYTFSCATSTFDLTLRTYFVDGTSKVINITKSPTTFELEKDVASFNYNNIKEGNITNIQVEEGTEATPYKPYTESSYTFSQPIDLYGNDDVQDVITAKEIGRKFIHVVYDGDENWKTSSSLVGRYLLDNVHCKHHGSVLCTQAMGVTVATATVNQCCISTANNINGRFLINTEFATVDEWKAHLASKPMEVVFELAEEVTEALPIADQIGLNSLLTYDGITYVEFIYDELEPTFKGKYGTSEVGGYTLESLLTARNNAL